MTDREKHIARKKKEMIKIAKMQARLIIKAAKIATLPCKRNDTLMRRMGKVLAICMQVRALDIQKQIIASQPIPNYVPGGVVPGGIVMVGESGPETVGGFQNCAIGEMVHVPIQWQNKNNDTTSHQHPHPHQQPPGPIHPVPGIDKEPDV